MVYLMINMPDEKPPKREIMIDASLLKESGCSMRLFLTLFKDLAEALPNIDMQFGSAFHQFAATMVRTDGNFALAIRAAKEIQARPCNVKKGKEYLTDARYLQLVCYNWWDWHVEKDTLEITKVENEYLVEKNFKLKVYEDDNLIIWLCGTIDFLGKVKNGFAAVNDYKTTAVKAEDYYFQPYQLSVQLRTYRHAVSEYAKLYPGSIWEELNKQMGGCFIYGIFLEPPSSGKDTRFIRSDLIQFKDWEMDEYKMMLHKKVKEIVALYYEFVAGHEPMREGIINGNCEHKFGLCKFADICMAQDDVIKKHIMNRDYVKRPYNPMMFGK